MKSKFLQLYKLVLEQSQIYKNQKIALVVGSFKPPHKGHWQMVCNALLADNFDKVIILISNISQQAISNRNVSLTHLKDFIKIQSYIDMNFPQSEIFSIVHMIDVNVKLPTLNQLKNVLIQILNIEKDDIKLNTMITKYLNKIQDTLFSSIRRTANNTEITPEISKQIFDLYIDRYGLQNKVVAQVSQSASPIQGAIHLINDKCFQSTVIIITSKKGGDDKKWERIIPDINKNIQNKTNIISYIPIDVQTVLSATDLRNNINDLTKEYFPDKLTENDIEIIKDLLNV